MSEPVVPDFFVIGAGRAGTTSLHHYLRQHPGVFLPKVKAPSHFYCVDAEAESSSQRRRETNTHFVPDRGDYERLFDGAVRGQVLGDVSPAYLSSVHVPARIAVAAPHARLVVILRDPTERVRARFDGRRRDGLETRPSLTDVVDDEIDGEPWPDDTAGTYLASGYVSHVLSRYLERFDRSQILIMTNEDLAFDTSGAVTDVVRFIGADPDVPIDTSATHNRSTGPIANPFIRRLWTGSVRLRTAVRPLVPESWRDTAFRSVVRSGPAPRNEDALTRLRGLFAEEVRRLSELTGRDLEPWTRGERVLPERPR